MRRIHVWLAMLALIAGIGLISPTASAATPYCGIYWGSQDKSNPTMVTSPVTAVRAGRHECFDRIVVDLAGPAAGYRVGYVPAVYEDGSGFFVPLRGGAYLQVVVLAPAYWAPANRGEVVAVGTGRLLDNGEVRPLAVKVGDQVVFGPYSGSNTIKVDGEELLVMGESEILAVVEA